MNGKIKTKFAALFAVALMITVCVVPVVGNEDVQAADVSSTIPEGISDIEIQLFTEDSKDFSDLIYCDNSTDKLPETVDPVEWMEYPANSGVYININENSEYFGTYLRYGQTGLTNAQILEQEKGGNWLPLIQTTYMYTEAVDIKISVTKENGEINGEDVIVDTGSKSFEKGGAVFEKVECASTIKFIGTYDPTSPSICMGFGDTLANASGTYKVSISSLGVPVANEKFTYQSEADMKEIAGTVKDASGTPVVIEGAKVAYKINGVDGYVESDENGKYEIVFVPGSVVSITSVTYPNDAYTFKNIEDDFNYSYDFGTVNGDKPYDIFAVEKTGKAYAKAVGGETIPGVSMGFKWYYEYKTSSTSTKYVATDVSPAGVTAGTVKVIGLGDDKMIKFTYTAPSGSPSTTGIDSYETYLINTSVSAPGFTFDVATIGNENDSTISSILSSKAGSKDYSDATTAGVSVQANEYLDTAVVKSKTSDLTIFGASIELTWYYQYKVESTDKYTIVSYAPSGVTAKGTATVLGVGEDGTISYSWKAPTLPNTGYHSIEAFLINTSISAPGFTFDQSSIESGKDTGILDQISKDGTKVFVKDETAQTVELISKEVAYSVSGNITGIPADEDNEYPEITVNYTNGVGTTTKAKWNASQSKYIYSFYVLAGNSSTITPVFDGYKFNKASYTIPTASGTTYAIDGPDYVASSTEKLVELNNVSAITGELAFSNADGKVAKITYVVDGKEYVTPIKIADGKATVTVYKKIDGNIVKIIGAELDGYFAYVGANGSLGTHKTNTFAYYVYNGDPTKPVVGFKFELYTIDSKLIAELESDITGSATIETDKTVDHILYNGLYILDVDYPAPPEVIGRQCIDVSKYANLTPVDVKIQYTASFNVDGDLTSGVGNEDIAAGVDGLNPYTYKAIPGSSIALKAPSIDNFEFVAWMVDGVVVSESADYTLKVDGACQVDALYSAVHYEEPAEGLSMNVLVIGIVILILGILAVAYGIISKKQ